MIYMELYLFFFHICIAEIYCHGDEEFKPKLLLISFDKKISNSSHNNPESKVPHILLSLKSIPSDYHANLNAIVNGCYPENLAKCEPIWVKNQRNNFETAIIDWPNQLVYNTSWPTFSFESNSEDFSLNLRLERMLNWMKRPATSLGMMFVNTTAKFTVKEIDNFVKNATDHAHENHFNLIFIEMPKNFNQWQFVGIGSKFKSDAISTSPMSVVDISLIISNVLELEDLKAYTDGNKALAESITDREAHHYSMDLFKLLFLSIFIAIAFIVSCVFIIGAIKNACNKKQKINHQYNLGMKQASSLQAPENAYLLNASDEDELFTDSLPHIQTSK